MRTQTGEVLGKTAARHTSAEFVAFLTDIVINPPRGKEIHVADNLSAMRYIRRYNKAPKTVKWKYADLRAALGQRRNRAGGISRGIARFAFLIRLSHDRIGEDVIRLTYVPA